MKIILCVNIQLVDQGRSLRGWGAPQNFPNFVKFLGKFCVVDEILAPHPRRNPQATALLIHNTSLFSKLLHYLCINKSIKCMFYKHVNNTSKTENIYIHFILLKAVSKLFFNDLHLFYE